MTEKEQNLLDGIKYAKDIGYAQYQDRKPPCWRGIESFEPKPIDTLFGLMGMATQLSSKGQLCLKI